MIRYSTNWMGPISTNWYKERGLLRPISRKIIEEGDVSEIVEYEVTTEQSGGRIDIYGVPDEHYPLEYGLPVMHGEDWNALSDWLDTVETDDLWEYEHLIEKFEEYYGKKIRWADDITN